MHLIIRPAIAAAITALLWLGSQHLFGLQRIRLMKPDENILGFFITTMIFVATGIAAAILGKVWLEWVEVRNSLRGETDSDKDEGAFSKYADERLAPTIKSSLLILLALLMAGFFFAPISYWLFGIFVTGGLAFGIGFYWEVLLDFDNYWTGVWNVDILLVPNTWKWAKGNKLRVMKELGIHPTQKDLRELTETQ
jgi:hypothetical protein